MRRGAHEARLVLDKFSQRSADWGFVESANKRLVLLERPLLRGSGHVGNVDDLQVRRRCDRGMADWNVRAWEDSPNVLEHERDFGGGGDAGGGNAYAVAFNRGMRKNDIRLDVILDELIETINNLGSE